MSTPIIVIEDPPFPISHPLREAYERYVATTRDDPPLPFEVWAGA